MKRILLVLFLPVLLAACRQDSFPTETPGGIETLPASPTAALLATATQVLPPTPSLSNTTTDLPPVTAPATRGLEGIAPGWTKIEPGGETRCAHNTPYTYWVHPGTDNRLLVFLQGGGGCWDAVTCAPGNQYYDQSVTEADSPAGAGGIFDLDNPENPFKDYSMVFIPSCTGDVHWGNYVRQYPQPSGGELTIHHRGFANASAALQWAYDHFPAPESVFVSGCSAGSAGSILFAPYVIEHYPQAHVAQLGDSLSFTFNRPLDMEEDYRAQTNFPTWIPALAEMRPGEFTMSRFYSAIANFYPQFTFSQYNTAYDRIQEAFFLALDGPEGAFPQAMRANLAEIHSHANNFRSYTAAGSTHCILPFDRFYTQITEEVRFRDWVADLASGKDIPNVQCEACESE